MRPLAMTVGAAVVAALVMQSACSTQRTQDLTNSPPVASVTITPPITSVQIGQTVQLAATTRDADGNVLTDRAIVWSSLNTGIAGVSNTGLVTGIAAGYTTIEATSEGMKQSATVTVTAPPPPPPAAVASVAVAPSSAGVQVGQTVQLAATTRDAGGNVLTGRAISWVSANPSWATVSSTGLVTGVAPGGVTITATSEGVSGSSAITVSTAPPPPPPPPAPVASVTVTPNPSSVQAGQTVQLTATLRDASGNVLTGRTITWSSLATGTATVSATGLVTGVAAGSTTIRATSETIIGNSALTVTAAPTPPAAPSGLAASVISTSQVNLSWADNATTETGYEVERHAGGTFARVAQLGANVTSWNNTGLSAGTTYSYRVRAVNATGPSGYSSTVTATTQSPPPPPPPPPGTPLFWTNWNYALGLTADAIQDGPSGNRKWDTWNNYNALAPPNEILQVVSASGLGFPTGMANVLRVRQRGAIDAEEVMVTNLPIPAVGEHRYFRVYTRVDETQNSSGFDHVIQPDFSGGCYNLWKYKRQIGSTGWHFQWEFSSTSGHQWYSLNPLNVLQKGVVYRIEWHIHRTGTSTFKFDTRVYDAAGTLLYDDNDFVNEDDGGGTLASRDPTFNISPSASCFDTFFLGNNGQAAWNNTGTFTYYGGVEIRADAWAGPWVSR